MTAIIQTAIATIIAISLLIIGILGYLLHAKNNDLEVAKASYSVCLSSNSDLHVSLDHQNEAVDRLVKDSAVIHAKNSKLATELNNKSAVLLQKASDAQKRTHTDTNSCIVANDIINKYLRDRK